MRGKKPKAPLKPIFTWPYRGTVVLLGSRRGVVCCTRKYLIRRKVIVSSYIQFEGDDFLWPGIHPSHLTVTDQRGQCRLKYTDHQRGPEFF